MERALRDQRAAARRLGAAQAPQERPPGDLGRDVKADSREHGRGDVLQAHGRIVVPRLDAGAPDHERDVQQLLIHRVAVLEAAVVEQLLAVVGGEHDEALLPQPALAQPREQALHRQVGGEDLFVVGRGDEGAVRVGEPRQPAPHRAEAYRFVAQPRGDAGREAPAHAGVGAVADVRLEEVHHGEELLLADRVEPAEGGVHRGLGGAVP